MALLKIGILLEWQPVFSCQYNSSLLPDSSSLSSLMMQMQTRNITSPSPSPAAADAMTAVATRLAAVCDMIQDQEHRNSGSAICAAEIYAMIDDVAAAADRTPITGTGSTKRRRMMDSASLYEEVGELGVGASGVVVKARHRVTGEAVAIKSLHPGGSGLASLLREACFMAACRGHPSLVALRGVTRAPAGAVDDGDIAEGYSLVMDYVGPSLLDVLQARGRPFPEAEVRGVMRQLLAGADAMHRRRVVHRDIKSENILVGSGGAVKICDFGCAKSMTERSPANIAGTIEYMAPEVLVLNIDHDMLVDEWSLGCVMAELLTGDLLFIGEDRADQLRKIFDVLGVPDERAWQALRPRVLAGEVKQWRAQQRQVRYRNRLRELLPGDLLSDDGFEVLKGLLTCDPTKRMTAAAALRCPWFVDHKVEDARVPAAPAVAMIEDTCLSASSLLSN